MIRKSLPLALAALTSLAGASPDPAQPSSTADGQLSLTLGVERSRRSLDGAMSDRPKASPTFGVDYQKGRFFASTQRGVGYELLRVDGLQGFVAAGADPGRKDGDRKDSPRFVGMGKVEGSALAILGVGYQALDGLLSFNAVHVQSARRSQGAQTQFSAALSFPLVGDWLTGTVSLGATHADGKHAQTYYGVTPAQAARSGHPAYQAASGWLRCELNLGLNYTIDANWSLNVSAGRLERRASAAGSPLYSTPKDTVGAVSASYRF